MPELEHHGGVRQRRIEVQDPDSQQWRKGTQEAQCVDGRAKIRFDDAPAKPEDVELADTRYRWLLGGREQVCEWA